MNVIEYTKNEEESEFYPTPAPLVKKCLKRWTGIVYRPFFERNRLKHDDIEDFQKDGCELFLN